AGLVMVVVGAAAFLTRSYRVLSRQYQEASPDDASAPSEAPGPEDEASSLAARAGGVPDADAPAPRSGPTPPREG
ncbi:hypothetical protein ACI4B7_26865, partial [Klebsiella pneumoniae]